MMRSERRRQLRERQWRLLQRSAVLRQQFSEQSRALQVPLAFVDQVGDGLNWLRRNPKWPVGAGVALAVMRPRAIFRWSGRAFAAWRLWRRVRPWGLRLWRLALEGTLR